MPLRFLDEEEEEETEETPTAPRSRLRFLDDEPPAEPPADPRAALFEANAAPPPVEVVPEVVAPTSRLRFLDDAPDAPPVDLDERARTGDVDGFLSDFDRVGPSDEVVQREAPHLITAARRQGLVFFDPQRETGGDGQYYVAGQPVEGDELNGAVRTELERQFRGDRERLRRRLAGIPSPKKRAKHAMGFMDKWYPSIAKKAREENPHFAGLKDERTWGEKLGAMMGGADGVLDALDKTVGALPRGWQTWMRNTATAERIKDGTINVPDGVREAWLETRVKDGDHDIDDFTLWAHPSMPALVKKGDKYFYKHGYLQKEIGGERLPLEYNDEQMRHDIATIALEGSTLLEAGGDLLRNKAFGDLHMDEVRRRLGLREYNDLFPEFQTDETGATYTEDLARASLAPGMNEAIAESAGAKIAATGELLPRGLSTVVEGATLSPLATGEAPQRDALLQALAELGLVGETVAKNTFGVEATGDPEDYPLGQLAMELSTSFVDPSPLGPDLARGTARRFARDADGKAIINPDKFLGHIPIAAETKGPSNIARLTGREARSTLDHQVRGLPFNATRREAEEFRMMQRAELEAEAARLGVAVTDIPTFERMQAERRAMQGFVRQRDFNRAQDPMQQIAGDVVMVNEQGAAVGGTLARPGTRPMDMTLDEFAEWARRAKETPGGGKGIRAKARDAWTNRIIEPLKAGESPYTQRAGRYLDAIAGTPRKVVQAIDQGVGLGIGIASAQSGQEIRDAIRMTRTLLTRRGRTEARIGRLAKELLAAGPDVQVKPEHIDFLVHAIEANVDVVLSPEMLATADALEAFLSHARGFEDEFIRGRYQFAVKDPVLRADIERLTALRWREAWRQARSQKTPGGPHLKADRRDALQSAQEGLAPELERMEYALGRADMADSLREIETRVSESLRAADDLLAQYNKAKARIPSRLPPPLRKGKMADRRARALERRVRKKELQEGASHVLARSKRHRARYQAAKKELQGLDRSIRARAKDAAAAKAAKTAIEEYNLAGAGPQQLRVREAEVGRLTRKPAKGRPQLGPSEFSPTGGKVASSPLQDDIARLQESIELRMGGAGEQLTTLGTFAEQTPLETVRVALANIEASRDFDLTLAKAFPGYSPRLDKVLAAVERMDAEDAFHLVDFVKRRARVDGSGAYGGLDPDKAYLQPVIDHYRRFFRVMLDVVQDHGYLRDWDLYVFLDRVDVGSYVHHTLSQGGKASVAKLGRAVSRSGSDLGETAGPLQRRGTPGTTSEIQDLVHWNLAEQIAKHKALAGDFMEQGYTPPMVRAGEDPPFGVVQDLIGRMPEELRFLETDMNVIATKYTRAVGKAAGQKMWWDDLRGVRDTYFPEAARFEAAASAGKWTEELTDTKQFSLDRLDNLAHDAGLELYGQPFERVSGAEFSAAITGRIPGGDAAVLDAIDVMVRNGADPTMIRAKLLDEFNLHVSVAEANTFKSGHVYLPADVTRFVKSQLREDLRHMVRRGAGQAAGATVDMYDNLLHSFKGWVTQTRLAFQGRNQLSGHVQSMMVHGMDSMDTERMWKITLLQTGMADPGALMKFGDETHTAKEWLRIADENGVFADRGAVADMERLAAGELLGEQTPNEVKRAFRRVADRRAEDGFVPAAWDELVAKFYVWAKDEAKAYPRDLVADAPNVMRGQMRGPLGRALTMGAAGAVFGGMAGMAGGGRGMAALMGAGGFLTGFLQSAPSEFLFKVGGNISQMSENNLRLINFFTGIDKGMGPAEAAFYVNKALFDYAPTGQSWFSYQFLRRAFPFWTFRSKNFGLYLWLMKNRPHHLNALNQILSGAIHHENTPELRAALPPYLQSRIAIHMGDGSFVAGLGLPIEDFIEALRPMRSGALQYVPGSAGMVGSANPWVMSLIELATDKSFFFDRELSEVRGGREMEHAPGWLQELVGYASNDEGGNPHHRIGTMLRVEGKSWVPASAEDAALRMAMLKQFHGMTLLKQWQILRAETYQDAIGEMELARKKVGPFERLLVFSTGIRTYHYDIQALEDRATMRMLEWLMEQYAGTDPAGVSQPGPRLRKQKRGSYMPAAEPNVLDLLVEQEIGNAEQGVPQQ